MKLAAPALLAFVLAVPFGASAQARHAPRALRVRAEPSPIARVIARVPAGTAFGVNGCDYGGGAWCAVTYNGMRGYVAARHLSGDVHAAAPGAARGLIAPTTGQAARDAGSAGGGETGSSSLRGYQVGVRGGYYTLTASGSKRYVDQSYCGGSARSLSSAGEHGSSGGSTTRSFTDGGSRTSAASRTYVRGPRGGCYYLTASGNKRYVEHSYCN